jgi:hypothetical protein
MKATKANTERQTARKESPKNKAKANGSGNAANQTKHANDASKLSKI